MSDDIEAREIEVTTGDGCRLHGDLSVPPAPVAAASVLHPHPLMGGDRHNGVVEAVVRALAAAGVATVRVDLRGVGRSTGSFGKGIDERLDAEAALVAVAEAAPAVPLWSIGYSFGGDVALSVDHPALAGWVAIAPPLSVLADPTPAAADGRPAHLVVPTHDQFTPPDRVRAATAGWADTHIVEMTSADHFLSGHLRAVADVVVDAVVGAGGSGER